MIKPAGSKPGVGSAVGVGASKGTGWLLAGLVLGQVVALAAGYGAASGVGAAQTAGALHLPNMAEEQSAGLAATAMLFLGTIVGPQLFAGLAVYRKWKPGVAAIGGILAGGLVAWSWTISTFGTTYEGVVCGAGIHAAWAAAGLVGAALSAARRKLAA